MNQERERHAKRIFKDVIGRRPAERPAFLDHACGGDASLRGDVEALLACDEDSSLLDPRPFAGHGFLRLLDEAAADAVPEVPGFRIVRKVGEGGMGEVWEAEQDHPARTVALKLLRPGVATAEAARRFRLEVQMLARLDHPGIARIYDAGTAPTPSGARPYFSMELVDGLPINAHLERAQPGLTERIELLIEIAQAVEHAHQRGVIHRDLKPANILVRPDSHPVILDFGVARLAGVDPRPATIQTRTGQIVGTLAYMSPEQAAGETDIDTRADVYSLGVLFHEVMGRRAPYALDRLSLEDALRTIREQEPVRLGSIDRRLRGDLETIARRALEKERELRYQSAAELAADMRRFLRNEPILARPPSAVYQLTKFARRNRLLVGAALSVFAVSIAGFAVSAAWYLKERESRRVAEAESARAWKAERLAEARRSEAERQRTISDAINRFLNGLFEEANPSQNPSGRTITVVEVLDRASRLIEGGFDGQPEVEAALRMTLGISYRELGQLEESRKHLAAARRLQADLDEPDPVTMARCLAQTARLHQLSGDGAGARRLYGEALGLMEGVTASDDRDVGPIHLGLASVLREGGVLTQAEHHARLAIAALSREGDELDLARAVGVYADVLTDRSEYASADRHIRRQLGLLEKRGVTDGVGYAGALSRLGGLLWRQTRYAEAQPLLERALAMTRRVYGDRHDAVAEALSNLAVVCRAVEDHDRAISLLEDAYDIVEANHEDGHPLLATLTTNLAQAHSYRGDESIAEELYREALDLQIGLRGARHPDTSLYHANLASHLARTRRFEPAEKQLRIALDILHEHFGREHGEVAVRLYDLALLHRDMGRGQEAEKELAEAVRIHRAVHSDVSRNLNLADCLELLASIHYRRGEHGVAARHLAETVSIHRAARGAEDLHVRKLMSGLAGVLGLAGRYEEGERLGLETYEINVRLGGASHPESRRAAETLANLYEAWGKADAAAAWRAKKP